MGIGHTNVAPNVQFDAALLRRYDQTGPRYTSYPTAMEFHANFTAEDYVRIAQTGNTGNRPLSLYFHIPFCATVCYYCACNKVVTKNRSRAQPYLDRLYREITLQGSLFSRERTVDQLHWGGGTPTFIDQAQMADLMSHTASHFTLRDDDGGEYSIEIDPREADGETMRFLRGLGFNRLSVGVQDFDPRVQRAVNRIQTFDETREVIDTARENGFRSINVDLIYGLPLQTRVSFLATLDKVLGLGPDRLSIFNYAHLPERFKVQRQIRGEDLPLPAAKLAILQSCIERLTDAGYVYIGMDHFARPGDELATAQRAGALYRNFQGYSTHADCDLVGLGVTAIGRIGDCYAQNARDLDEYCGYLDRGELPVTRGVLLTRDDIIRRSVISSLMCNFKLDFSTLEREYGIDVQDYFAADLVDLRQQMGDGLVVLGDDGIRVTARGRLLIRNICMVFDMYRRGNGARKGFSRAI